MKIDDVRIADALLLQFCRKTERLFGNNVVTPNMHMSCHLVDCILDYGPIHNFWLFAFERFNGVIGQLPNNNQSIEVQMMKQFLCDSEVIRVVMPSEFRDDFESLVSFQGISNNAKDDGLQTSVKLPHSSVRCVFDECEMDELVNVFSSLYPSANDCEINLTYLKYATITMEGKIFASFTSR